MRTDLIVSLGCVAPAVGVFLVSSFKPIPFLATVFPTRVHVAFAVAGCMIPGLVLALMARGPRVAAFLLGAVLAIDAYYGVAVAPMATTLIVLTAAFGLGLIGFAPLWSLIANGALWRRLEANWDPANGSMRRRAALGFGLVLAALVVVDVPALVAEVAIRKGTDNGLGAKLRNRDAYRRVLLSYCYPGKRTGSAPWTRMAATVFAGPEPDVRAARAQFAKIEGKRFDAIPRPDCVLCPNRGGTDVYPMPAGGPELTEGFEAMHRRPIKLVGSKMVGTANAALRMVTLNWTLELEAPGWPYPQDRPTVARFHVAVPPGMKLTAMRVDGAEARAVLVYETGCAVRHDDMVALATREAAELAVEATLPRLDPNSSAVTKIELALAIAVGGTGDAALRLPFITSRNMDVLEVLMHRVELGRALELTDAELASPAATIQVPLTLGAGLAGVPAGVSGLEVGQGFCVRRSPIPSLEHVHHSPEAELPVICPVPEPGEWALLAIVLVARGWAWRAPGAPARRA